LKRVAQQQGLNLPEEMSKQDQATYDRFSKLEGKQSALPPKWTGLTVCKAAQSTCTVP